MTTTTDNPKWMSLFGLNTGDKVNLSNGSVAEFIRLKRTKFIGTIDGKSFNIPVDMYVSLHSEGEKTPNAYMSLCKGEPFYINRGGKAVLYIFDHIDQNDKIVGIQPISKGMTRIDNDLFAGKVADIRL